MTDVDIDSYDSYSDDAGEHRRGKVRTSKSMEFTISTSTRNTDRLTDPVRCPMCSRILQCPRDKDYEQFMERKNIKCLSSEDPVCLKASARVDNKAYIERIKAAKKVM